MEQSDNLLYSPAVLDFVRVSAEYCRQLESERLPDRDDFLRIMRGLLPMLYLKATLLGELPEAAGWNNPSVTEADYEYVRSRLCSLMGEYDTFLDVFQEEFKYSDTPVARSVSELMADIYQTLGDLLAVYREEDEEAMNVALSETINDFRYNWGHKLLSVLSAIHEL